MRLWPDCIYCILRMAVTTVRSFERDEKIIKRFVEKILKLAAFHGNGWDMTPPAVIQDVWLILQKSFGTIDPLQKVKKEQNDMALMLYTDLKKSILKHENPLEEALTLSIIGNSIDIMRGKVAQIKNGITTYSKGSHISQRQIKKLKKRLAATKKLVYLGDNCGEIVFDKLFIELITRHYDIDVTFVVRSKPVLNDATLSDALYVGMDTVARVIENGIPFSFPGFAMNTASPSIKKLIEESDLIIAKGGGNYDTMTEEKLLKGKTFFLVQSKCEPYCIIHNTELGSLIIDDF